MPSRSKLRPPAKYFCRYKVDLSAEGHASLDWYLHRAMLFWNHMVEQLAPKVMAYLYNNDPSPAVDEAFAEQVRATYVTLLTEMPGETAAMIRELDTACLEYRLQDLIAAYADSRQKRRQKPPAAVNLPSTKHPLGRLSIQFEIDEAELIRVMTDPSATCLKLGAARPLHVDIAEFKDTLAHKLRNNGSDTPYAGVQFSISREVDKLASANSQNPSYSCRATIRYA